MATTNGNHSPLEGIAPNVDRDKNAATLGSLNPQQGPYGPTQGSYGPPIPTNFGPPSQGNFGQPPATYGHVGMFPAPGSYGTPPGGLPGGPVTNQPGHGWMNMPQTIPNCPPGLEYLTMIDQLLVHQEIEILELVTKYETENKFTIYNSLGQKVYKALENSDACMRNCCGSLRPFEIKILDNFGKPVIYLNRPLACQGCCCPCSLQKMEVFSPPGTLVGSIEQEWSFWVPKFAIKNTSGDIILRISGPYCTMACCGDVDFQVLTADGSNQVGKISKKWTGYAQENYTDADNFGINFPMDLDVRVKAVMLGACFLIDMMYYERRGKQNSRKTNTAAVAGDATSSSTGGTVPINRI